MAFDGKVLWVADNRQKTIMGYNFDEKMPVRPKAMTITAVRDLAFWYPLLVTAYPGYLAFINPVNADVVERVQLPTIQDPVGIAVDKDLAYIADRNSGRIHRFHLKDRNFLGTFPLMVPRPRGMTFARGFLWIIDKEQRVYKVSVETGEILSFIPLPPDSYGLAFVGGTLYVSRPGEALSVDYIETENYVAALEKKYELRALLKLNLPWPKEQQEKEIKLSMRFVSLPQLVRQRLQRVDIRPHHFRLQRLENGEAVVQLNAKTAYSENPYRLTAQLSLYDFTHFFHSLNIKKYFEERELPEPVRDYLEREALKKLEKSLAQNLREIKKELDGRHPIYILPKLKDYGFKSLEEEILAMRYLGIPARKALFWDSHEKKAKLYLQIYVAPVGWVTRTELYNPERPKEFPVSRTHIELFYPESLVIDPIPKNEKGEALPWQAEDLVVFQSIELAERDD
ncbi:MAG: hypothetical protein NZM25_05125 [Leptospiraceae bacterium]|nr:hypothetical protein [Leptospiraceae bacterium]MDW8305610.1 hypothetical protein [Leptospiraceae bacterium]